MKLRILPRKFVVFILLLTVHDNSIAQPKIAFSELSAFTDRPLIIGQTPVKYFCLYPKDSTPQLVIYNTSLKEESRMNWYSLAAPKPGITYQPFILNNNLVVLAHEKNGNIITIKCLLYDENGKFISEKKLITDYSYKGQLNRPYDVEISKNGKYIMFYRGARLDEETIVFKGYLFDNDWNNLKEFSVPIDKNETGDSWDGALVDIEGNIHTIVYTVADSWKLGSRIAIHTIAKESNEARSEKIEVLKKRLFNFSVSEDTSAHTIRLQATIAWQHQKDALAGIAFLSVPYSRTRKIEYASYQFTMDEKKRLAKNITAEKKLITNANIEFPSTVAKGGSFFTAVNVHGDYIDDGVQIGNPEQPSTLKLEDLYLNDRITRPTNDDVLARGAGNGQDEFLASTSNWLNRQSKADIVTESFSIFKNNEKGGLESSAIYIVKKVNTPFYKTKLFPLIHNDSLFLLGYLEDINEPALFLLSENGDNAKKIDIPKNNLLLFSSPSRISDNSSLFPYIDIKTKQYGLAKIMF